MKRKVNQAAGQDKQLEDEKRKILGVLSETRNKLYELNSHYKEQTLKEIHQKDSEMLDIRTAIHKLVDRAKRLNIKSPVMGIVKGLKLAEGSVLQSGAIVFDVVPLDNKMIVEVKIKPRDIGHIKVGYPVNVKVTSYDYAKYGSIPGKLTSISASTFVEKSSQEQYYKGVIELSKHYVGSNPKKNHVIPGMVVIADIMTGDKTMLAYLLKPINRSLDNAFQER